MKIGVQLYTLRKEMEHDFVGVLEQVSKIGYQGVEFAGFGGLTAKELKGHLDRLNLQATSCHTRISELEDNYDEFVAYNKAIGNKNLVIAWSDLTSYENYLDIALRLKKIIKKLEQDQMQLHYHNHSHEFVLHEDSYLMDRLYQELRTLKPEIDLFWVKNAGLEPIDYYHKYQDRVQLLHFKGMKVVDGKNTFAPVGEGIIDYQAIYKEAKDQIDWIIVENDKPENGGIEDITISMKNLKNIIE